jgi:hypothetical protein
MLAETLAFYRTEGNLGVPRSAESIDLLIVRILNAFLFDIFLFFSIIIFTCSGAHLELNREPCGNRGRARRCNRGRKLH